MKKQDHKIAPDHSLLVKIITIMCVYTIYNEETAIADILSEYDTKMEKIVENGNKTKLVQLPANLGSCLIKCNGSKSATIGLSATTCNIKII